MSPVYEYRCLRCKEELDLFLSIEERDSWTNLPCPSCGYRDLIREINSCAFKVKGANAKNGYSTNVKDIEKRLGREITNEDLD